MPYSPDHSARTRARIVDSARRLFTRRGFNTVSIDEIMAGAEMTRGGFYHHFKTKEDLYKEVIFSQMEQMPDPPGDGTAEDTRKAWRILAAEIVRDYLSQTHLRETETQCVLVALPSDSARAGSTVRQAYQAVLCDLIALFEGAMTGTQSERRRKAQAMATLCVGGMVIARTMDDAGLADDICASARAAAYAIGDLGEGTGTP